VGLLLAAGKGWGRGGEGVGKGWGMGGKGWWEEAAVQSGGIDLITITIDLTWRLQTACR
jgi:hypothetical protein